MVSDFGAASGRPGFREETMIRQIFLAGALAGLIATPALSAEAIEGTWLRPSTGTLVKFAPCGSAYCGTVLNGSYKGKSIGKLSGSGGNYKGKITDLAAGKTYTGKAKVSGNTMDLKGCVLAFCRGEKWNRK